MSTSNRDPFSERPRRNGWVHVLGVVAILAVAFAFVVTVFDWHPFRSDTSGKTGVVAIAPQDAKCNGFTVKLDPNWSYNIYSHGLSPKTEQMRTETSVGSKQDPRALQLAWNASPMGDPLAGGTPITDVTQIAPLKDGECFTPFGVEKYGIWNAMWMNPALTKLTPDALPANGVNSGATPGGQAFEQAGAIPSGTGVRVDHFDATGKLIGTYWYRLECGNIVKAGAATVVSPPPPGTTIVHTPPPPTATPPPGCVGNCFVPPPPPPPPSCENGGLPPELCVPVVPPPTCENGGLPPEQCQPPVVCPPGTTPSGNGLCKDYGNGPEPSLPPQILGPNPAPNPQYQEPVTPVLPPPPPAYTPPPRAPVIPVPVEQGGPTALPTPRATVPAPLPEVPTATSAPEAGTCVISPGKASC